MKRAHSERILEGKQEEDVQNDVILLIKEYLATNDPEKLVDFTKLVFSFIAAYQKNHPEKKIGADRIPEIFEEIVKPLLSSYGEDIDSLEDIYNFLLSMDSYLSKTLRDYLDEDKLDSMPKELAEKFHSQSEAAFKVKFLNDRGEVSEKDKADNIKRIEELVYTRFRKILDFVRLLHGEIHKRLSDQIIEKHKDSFRKNVYEGVKQGSEIQAAYKLSQSSSDEAQAESNAILLLQQYVDTDDAESLVSFIKMIFSILVEKQKENSGQDLGRDAIRSLFLETIQPLVSDVENVNLLEKVYKFLMGVESYIYTEKEGYASASGVGEQDFMLYQFACTLEPRFEEQFRDFQACGSDDKIQSSVKSITNEYFSRAWCFVSLLRKEIKNKLLDKFEAQHEHESHFKEAICKGVEQGSRIKEAYNHYLTVILNKKAKIPVIISRPPKSRWKRFKAACRRVKASWKSLSLKWKVFFGIVIALEVGLTVACALVFPPSVLFMAPGSVAITTKSITIAAGTASVALVTAAHVAHAAKAAPVAVASKLTVEDSASKSARYSAAAAVTVELPDETEIGLGQSAVLTESKVPLHQNQSGFFSGVGGGVRGVENRGCSSLSLTT